MPDFISYDYGPFSIDIAKTLDLLISEGLIIPISFLKSQEGERVEYQITNYGKEVCSKLVSYKPYKQIYEISLTILNSIHYYNLTDLVSIVYEEPEFKAIQSKGLGSSIPISLNKESIFLLMEPQTFFRS